MFAPQTEWVPPSEFKDLNGYDEIAIDLETCDPNIKTRGSGSVVGDGKVVGIAVATHDWCGYFPFDHLGGGNLDRNRVLSWFKRCFKNTLYENIS